MAEEWKYAVKDAGNGKYPRYCILVNGKSLHGEKTEVEYIMNGYKILTESEFEKLIDDFEDSLCGKWCEISEDAYQYALNVLPPLKWYNGGFFSREYFTGNVTAFYQELDGKYYTSLQRTSYKREFLLESLKLSIEFGAVEDKTQEE